MTTLDVPCDGQATFRRLNVRGLWRLLMAEERAGVWTSSVPVMLEREEAVATFLRPFVYLQRGLGA